MRPKFKLRLYVSQDNSGQALARLYKALEHHPYTDYELAIMDISEHHGAALSDGVAQTPTIVSLLPDGETIVSPGLDDVKTLRKIFGFREEVKE
jgi:hypothetical protein